MCRYAGCFETMARISEGVELPGAPRLNGDIQRVKLAYNAAIEWPQANEFRQQLELRSKAEIESAIQANPRLAKFVDLTGDVPRLRDAELHVTLTGGVNEAIEARRKASVGGAAKAVGATDSNDAADEDAQAKGSKR